MTQISDVEGIGASYAKKLQEADIKTVEQLLDQGATAKGRQSISTRTGITAKLILEWVNRADLARVKGVGSEYADLLEHAGVDTVKELAQRNGANLHAKMEEINAARKLVRRVPTLTQIEGWIAHAKSLPRAVSH